MKSFNIFLVFLALSMDTFSQQLPQDSVAAAEAHYHKLSKIQGIMGWIITSAGGIMLTGTILLNNDFYAEDFTVPYLTSAVLLGSGIGLLVASSNNRKKANALTVNLHLENSGQVKYIALNRVYYPALKMSFNF